MVCRKIGASFVAIALASLLGLVSATQASAVDEIPITPDVIAEADRIAVADPLTDDEMEEIAEAFAQEYSAEQKLSVSELKKLDSQLASGELTVWANGRQVQLGRTRQVQGASSRAELNPMAIFVPQTWAACGAFDPEYKNVRTFYLNTIPYTYRPVYLKCGTSGWGYRHILARHMTDWQNKAIYVGANWREMADFAITDALQHVYSGTYNPINQTYSYRGVVELRRYDGKTMHTFYPRVAVSAGDYRIITAFPSSTR